MNTKIKNAPQQLLKEKLSTFYEYKMIILSFFISAGIFYSIRFLEEIVYDVYVAEHFLAIHTITELASIIMYIASFLIIYYVGGKDKRVRMKLLAGVLLYVGFIDFWHTFSYRGMPGLLGPSSAQSATVYWIIGRFVFAGGILVSSFIPIRLKLVNINNWIIAGVPFILSFLTLAYVNAFPDSLPLLFVEGQGLTSTKILLEYSIIFMLLIAFVNFLIEFNKTKSYILSLFISALIISVFSELAFVHYASVYDTYNLIGHIYKVIASYMIFKVLFIFNIHYPYKKLDRAEKEISKYANNLEQLVELRTQEIHQVNQEMLRDLEYAKSIQKGIMTVKHEEYGNLEVYSEYVPYEKVGGDYYGFEELGKEYVGFYIGDVAGHGIPAAMMTIFMKQTIVSEKLYESGIKEIFSPKEVLLNLYREYNETDFPLEMYAVMIYGVYNKLNNNLIFSSAGLNTYPLIYKGEGKVDVIKHSGFPICKFDKDYVPEFQDYEVPLEKGEKVLFYTDGLIEISNKRGIPFGENRLIELLGQKGHLAPVDLSKVILDDINHFTRGVKLNDDVHYFIMEVK